MLISLIGLPGAGKTTLGRSLSSYLHAYYFGFGDALRDRARSDAVLREQLGRGMLAPEPLVIELLSEAISRARQTSVILDGLPRHAAQLSYLEERRLPWKILYLDVTPSVAVTRVLHRRTCQYCGLTFTSSGLQHCTRCGKDEWISRPEDNEEVLQARIASSQAALAELIASIFEEPVIRINADLQPELVLQHSIEELRGK